MNKKLTVLIISAMAVLFAVGCSTEEQTPETPAETPVETPVETPAETPVETPSETPEESEVAVTSLLESRELTDEEQSNLEKVVRFMRTVDDTVQVALFEMTEIDGGFNMEFILKNNFADATVVEEGTIISIMNQDQEEIEVALPMDIEIEPDAGVLFEAEVITDLLASRNDVYFIEFKAEEAD
ncbi:hypothetical protein ACHAL6_14335 [Proteiniclasticum sp. C24MP]|uniref:hypothetical protein n=1 Tax=Proteiniclasticum sp. C24MP TaxID=3374101 RepID=UPI00375418F4